ncbi:DUF4823 domain-containing protein [Vibrio nomapromontoriensis]|uniref:DUF4823 domain-containing protein n=1 Tax=Vibrio nomapromontoriensis TaxID=2910246 RepID=UPI003D0A4CC3
MKKHIFLISALALSGCADTHKLNVSEQSSTNKIASSSSVYIALSHDGIYGEKYYIGSGKMLSNIIRARVISQTNDVSVATTPESLRAALATASEKHYDYLLYPTIMHWEDRATEWSGKPDKVEVKISTWDVSADQEVNSVIIEGKSGLGTFGGDHPQDLLPQPISEYLDTLFDSKV